MKIRRFFKDAISESRICYLVFWKMKLASIGMSF